MLVSMRFNPWLWKRVNDTRGFRRWILHVEIALCSVLRQFSVVKIFGWLAIRVFVSSGHRVTLEKKKWKMITTEINYVKRYLITLTIIHATMWIAVQLFMQYLCMSDLINASGSFMRRSHSSFERQRMSKRSRIIEVYMWLYDGLAMVRL